MGILSNLSRPREPRLPVYESLKRPTSPTKERYSGSEPSDSDLSDDDSFSDSSISHTSSPRHHASSSRHTSDTRSSRASILRKPPAGSKSFPSVPKRKMSPSRRGLTLYRLPNKVVRYLCIGMMTTICLFIFSLVRASQLENKRILAGKVEKKPPPPPVWEGFKFLTRYYGGIRTLVPFEENVPQYPRMEDEQPYNATASKAVAGKVHARDFPLSQRFEISTDGFEECFLDVKETVRVPSLHYYKGRPSGFPEHVVGAYDVLDLAEDICYERYGRFGPYGYGYSVQSGGLGAGEQLEREGADEVFKGVPKVQWKGVDWAEVQKRCYGKNAGRYKPFVVLPASPRGMYVGGGEKTKPVALQARAESSSTSATVAATSAVIATSKAAPAATSSAAASAPKPAGTLPRTAFVVRAWDTYTWKEEDIMTLRSIISEVSLSSGGAYDVHLLIEVKDDAKHPIWADDDVYRSVINASVPIEFQGLATLWSQTQMLATYQGLHDLFARGPNLPVHGSYRGLQMAMQWFAHTHPEYEYFWQWEMDIRYTGHYLDLLTKMGNWAKAQPRKGLWERNSRFYIPSVHGTWEDFRQMVRVQSETPMSDPLDSLAVPGSRKSSPSSSTPKKEQIVWGPLRPPSSSDHFETSTDPTPPTSYDRDHYTWGTSEEADLITLNPLFDPDGTTWGLADDITGYNRSSPLPPLPRRAQIITASRMSRRLLITMHRETAHKKHHAFPEMWPATVALHHGLKAVYVPHPVYVDREWPVEYLARVLNGGRNGATGGARTSVFGEREHNLRGMTWFYNSGFGGNLYRRWLGLKSNNDGGEDFEKMADEEKDDLTVNSMKGGEGRMCLPPMLLHPVKQVDMPVVKAAEVEEIVSDPGA